MWGEEEVEERIRVCKEGKSCDSARCLLALHVVICRLALEKILGSVPCWVCCPLYCSVRDAESLIGSPLGHMVVGFFLFLSDGTQFFCGSIL